MEYNKVNVNKWVCYEVCSGVNYSCSWFGFSATIHYSRERYESLTEFDADKNQQHSCIMGRVVVNGEEGVVHACSKTKCFNINIFGGKN